ncbi:MAG: tRNA (guanosine(37)-N1)-methyltransferase TrmD [Lachnospiraceae bacterium]|nr:tRNA (guanosine(37)-N1)-methyltransferase TrmD [Lachnospiraceae bacterium]
MNFYVMTLFPDMIEQGLNTSIIGRAMEKELLSIKAVNIRDYTMDKHKRVDDYPYGGGAGMLMAVEPVVRTYQSIREDIAAKTGSTERPRVVYVTPWGRPFHQEMAREFAREENLVFLCGHYEGIDERALEEVATDFVSIGDYVLTGGELPAMVMIDAISRLIPGVLNNKDSAEYESFAGNLLEHPQYTRPEEYNGKKVPEVLLSGHHAKIEAWKKEQSLLRTQKYRPDLLEQ